MCSRDDGRALAAMTGVRRSPAPDQRAAQLGHHDDERHDHTQPNHDAVFHGRHFDSQ